MSITRRDFLNGFALTVAAGLTPLEILRAAPRQISASYYPPSLTGLRGNHDGSFENAHKLGRAHHAVNLDGAKVEEHYDLVVVGGGISGLAAAHYYRKKHPQAKVLILDNHDDFGGHAKRNEFKVGNRLMLGYGGTESLQSPKHVFSKEALALMKELTIDIDGLASHFHRNFYPDLKLSRGVFFNKEDFGVDKTVGGDPYLQVADDIDPKRLNARPIRDFINDFPMSKKDRDALIALHTSTRDYLGDMPKNKREAYLAKISYSTYLSRHVGLSATAIRFFQSRSNDFQAVGIDGLPALDARNLDLPGFHGVAGLGKISAEAEAELRDPYIYHFPDGNASIARLLVRKMIPQAAPGKDMNDIVLARFDYSKLDLPENPVRLRLNSTVVRVENAKGPVDVGYLDKGGRLRRVQGRHVVMACYNMMIPHIMPELENDQKQALAMNVKAPLVYTKVVLKHWDSFMKLGVHELYCPSMPYSRIKMDYPVDLGGYQHPRKPSEPMCLHMVYVPTIAGSNLDPRTQWKMGRAKLLAMPFSEHENMIRSQLQRILGPVGFDHNRDIAAITVNRWSHGYSYFLNSMYDDEEESKRIIATARRPAGKVAIANSDSDWNPYTHAAIDQAWRAVNELS